MFGQHLQLLIQHFQAFYGNIIGLDIVDGNLQMIETGAVQPFDAVGH